VSILRPRGPAIASRRRRVAVRVDGVVQGVGFRPFVFGLASGLGLTGFVGNDARGVVIEVEGVEVDEFLRRLRSDAPPLASITAVEVEDVPPQGTTGFVIAPSVPGSPQAPVTADAATCDACLRELFDPADRRYRYPFVNCTDCGPRFTIVRGVPYDRPATTMAGFTMCARCQAEYDDPADRRFHAQPNACPACGPRARLVDPRGVDTGERDAVRAAATALLRGAIVAIKGIGGYHLACRADDELAVATLRERKRREEKPFALMVRDLEAARALVALTPEAETALTGVEGPIVLAERVRDAPVARTVAPSSAELGLMLPYTPLQHLLLHDVGAQPTGWPPARTPPLVMTSGNVSDEPIAFRDGDAFERLADIADLFLVHDRPIETRTDDSVVRPPAVLRRSRGFVPRELRLPLAAPRPILGCGAELKSTFCLVRGDRAWLGHHIGDLTNHETLASFEHGVEHLSRLFAVVPEIVAHDLHPQYLSTAYAERLEGVELVGVQHHHAHLAACLAEHGATEPAVGAIFDGVGLGDDGTAWGGEILVGDLRGYERASHLYPVRLPGGDMAAREPYRMACAWLVAAGDPDPPLPPALRGRLRETRWRDVTRLAVSGLASPVTTSAGRLFDAVAALCGGPLRVTYEGQAAMELEARCDPAERGAYAMPGLDARPAVLAAALDAARDVDTGRIAMRFHRGLARATADACLAAAERHGAGSVVLSGGVFQNRRLLALTGEALRDAGIRVLVPRDVPPNDGGIAFGQVAVAAARSAG
jgi:hydrogenase maturation protein HypF